MQLQRTASRENQLRHQHDDWDEVHQQLIDVQQEQAAQGKVQRMTADTQLNNPNTTHLSDYIDTKKNAKAGSIDDGLITATEEYQQYKNGKWSKAEWSPGQPALSDSQALLACKLLLREMQNSQKEIDFNTFADEYALRAVKQQAVVNTMATSYVGKEIVWNTSSLDDRTDQGSTSFRNWVLNEPSSAPLQEIPPMSIVPTYTMNCWEIILHAALNAKVIGKEWVENLYRYKYKTMYSKLYPSFEKDYKKIHLDQRDWPYVFQNVIAPNQNNPGAIIDQMPNLMMTIPGTKTLLSQSAVDKAYDLENEINRLNKEVTEKTRKQLITGPEITYWSRDKKGAETSTDERPLPGDIVFFDGFSHIAIATGNLAAADESPEIITFWPAPDQPLYQWNRVRYGTYDESSEGVYDKVKVTSIQQMIGWDKEHVQWAKTELSDDKKKADAWKKKAKKKIGKDDTLKFLGIARKQNAGLKLEPGGYEEQEYERIKTALGNDLMIEFGQLDKAEVILALMTKGAAKDMKTDESRYKFNKVTFAAAGWNNSTLE